jgi:hypothetical protein
MLIYHINIGWPVLDDTAKLLLPPCEDVPRDEDAADGLARARMFEPPTDGYREKVYYRDPPASADGLVRAALVNRGADPPLGVGVSFRKRELPRLIQWKMMGRGHYVCGIEPANCLAGGRAEERRLGRLVELGPGESREFRVEIGVLNSAGAISEFERAAAG